MNKENLFINVTAATLAVGTEVTDGQIIDRNSAWISQRLARVGVKVVEHRAVADDRVDIARALRELSTRVDLLFVTGGLGPTTDDFTRDILAECFARPLEYNEESWQQILAKFKARGTPVSSTQRQQCYFPRGARILENPAGTANGFCFDVEPKGVRVYALPGPPSEVAAVWEKNLVDESESWVPSVRRDVLHIYRCLGKGEGELSDLTEAALKGSGLRIGYRAHVPYVEIKLWMTAEEKEKASNFLEALEKAIGPWLVGRDDEDLAQTWMTQVLAHEAQGFRVRFRDFASGGVLQERVLERLRASKLWEAALPLTIETVFSEFSVEEMASMTGAVSAKTESVDKHLNLVLWANEERRVWFLAVQRPGREQTIIEIQPPYIYKLRSERARRYVTERVLLELVRHEGVLFGG